MKLSAKNPRLRKAANR